MPYGSFLRTNYRTTGAELDIDAIGRGFTRGSGYGGTGDYNLWWGGFVVFSFNGHNGSAADQQSVIDSCYWVSVTDIFNSYYGAARASLTGFKVMPVYAGPRYTSAQAGAYARVGWSVSDSLIFFKIGSQASLSVPNSTCSARIIAAGFIVSGP